MTPVGSSLVAVPYSVHAVQSEDANTAATVRYTGPQAQNLALLTTCVHGDEPVTGTGAVSGKVGGVCEPMTHSASVRVQGQWAIRHADEWWGRPQYGREDRNTVGKLYYVRSQETFGATPAMIDKQLEAYVTPADGRGNNVQPCAVCRACHRCDWFADSR